MIRAFNGSAKTAVKDFRRLVLNLASITGINQDTGKVSKICCKFARMGRQSHILRPLGRLFYNRFVLKQFNPPCAQGKLIIRRTDHACDPNGVCVDSY
jgi:hypothetical protein